MMTTEQKATPRPAWEVLREAAEIIAHLCMPELARHLRHTAKDMEAAAALKPPPTLAEAVRGYDAGDGTKWKDVMAALARAEAGQ